MTARRAIADITASPGTTPSITAAKAAERN
jgi:hypothetical protein